MSKNMKKNVIKLNPDFVGDDCCLVMLPSSAFSTIIGEEEGVIYSEANDEVLYNSYLEDDSVKFRFPYHDKPTHLERKKLFNVEKYVNQILKYGNPYILFGYNSFVENIVLKNNSGAYLISSQPVPAAWGNGNSIVNRNELLEMFSCDNCKNLYFLKNDGTLFNNFYIPETSEVIENYSDSLKREIEYFNNPDIVSSIDDYGSIFTKCNMMVKKSKQEEIAKINNFQFNPIPLFDCKFFYVLRVDYGHVFLEKYDISVVGDNKYSLTCDCYIIDHFKNGLSDILKSSRVKQQRKPDFSFESGSSEKKLVYEKK